MKVTGLVAAIVIASLTVACQPGDTGSSAALVLTEDAPDDGHRVDSRLPSQLFAALGGGTEPSASALDYLSGERETAAGDPLAPTVDYLVAEIQLQRGEIEKARDGFRKLTNRAVSNYPAGPYGDSWGSSGLVVPALWRWLTILDEHGPRDQQEVDNALETASRLQETRLYTGMVTPGLLPALPRLEEEIAHLLAHLAWKNDHKDEAIYLFLDFLAIDSKETNDEIEQQIYERVFEQGLATPDRLTLFTTVRQLGMSKTQEQKDGAAATLKALWDNQQVPADVRATAGYEWATYYRLRGNRAELVGVLDGVIEIAGDTPVAEKAIYRRGLLRGDAGREDLLEVVERFPNGSLVDDALSQLASSHLFAVEIDRALDYYTQLQELQGPHGYQDSAYYFPALALVGRHAEGDMRRADALLDAYVERYPDGVYRARSIFWRGRIAEEEGDTSTAVEFFEQVVKETPYDYYGLRARMHLEEGADARSKDIPDAGSMTRAAMRRAYAESRNSEATPSAPAGPYRQRLETAISSGLYAELLQIDERLVERLDDLDLSRLESRGGLPASVLLLSLRQDALAAKDADTTPGNWLALASLLTGSDTPDWPTAIEMTYPRSSDRRHVTDLQNNDAYLATVYPDLDRIDELTTPLADAAWPIEGSPALSQSLMYSVIRHESRFYPGAISTVGALGLFQFMPATFRGLQTSHGWDLLGESGAGTATEYLLDPSRNVALWARWVDKEFPIRDRGSIAMALMKHQAGSGNVSKWSSYWDRLGEPDDLEYRLETARFAVTRNFVRLVLQDTAIVDAAGIFARQPR